MRTALAAGGAALIVGVSGVTYAVSQDTAAEPPPPNFVAGPCGGSIAPDPDPCAGAQGMIQYGFFGSIINADQFKKWKSANPGEYAKLSAFMASPTPQGIVLNTHFGAALVTVVQTYALVRGSTPITWAAPNPPPAAGSTDKKPPTAPGPIEIVPESPTN